MDHVSALDRIEGKADSNQRLALQTTTINDVEKCKEIHTVSAMR